MEMNRELKYFSGEKCIFSAVLKKFRCLQLLPLKIIIKLLLRKKGV